MIVISAGLSTLAACSGDSPAQDQSRPAFRAEIKKAQIPGAKVAYYERGQGPPLLMCMGSGSTMAEWDPALLRLLSQHFRLIVFDYPGIGLSSHTRQAGLTYGRMADSAAHFLDKIGVGRANVLGWSMGSFVAQQLAIRHPENVNGLVLAGTNPGGSHASFGPAWASDIDSDPDATEKQVMSTLFSLNRSGRKAAREFARRRDHAAETGEAPDDFEVPRTAYLAQVHAEDRWYRTNSNYDSLPQVAARTIVTGGRNDVLIPTVNGRLVAGRIPGAKLQDFEGGHAFLFQFREQFASAVNKFLGP